MNQTSKKSYENRFFCYVSPEETVSTVVRGLQDVEAEVVLRMICLNEAETDAQTPPDGYGQVLIDPPENFPSWAAYMEFISEQAFNEAKKRQETDEK